MKRMCPALQAPGLKGLEYTNSCQLARFLPELPGQMLPSAQGARAHVDLGLGRGMVMQVKNLADPTNPQPQQELALGPLCALPEHRAAWPWRASS